MHQLLFKFPHQTYGFIFAAILNLYIIIFPHNYLNTFLTIPYMRVFLFTLFSVTLIVNLNARRILIDSDRGLDYNTDSTSVTPQISYLTGANHDSSEISDDNYQGHGQLKEQQQVRVLQGLILPNATIDDIQSNDNQNDESGNETFVDPISDDDIPIDDIPDQPANSTTNNVTNNQTFNATANSTTNNVTNNQTFNTKVPAWLNFQTTEQTTYLTDRYNYFVTTKNNRVWAGAMNLMWDEMKRNLLNGQNPTFSNIQTSIQAKLIENLNEAQISKKDMSESSYYVSSGFGQDTVERINFQVRQKFPNKTFEDLNLQLLPQSFISYAYIYKNLQFKVPFEDDPYFKFKGESTPGFKAVLSKQKNQIYYKYYNDSGDFLMGIDTRNPNDELLFLKNPHKQVNDFSFQKILTILEMYDKMPNIKITKRDQFQMPNLQFDYSRMIKQMIGLQFANPNVQGFPISGIYQRLKLKITKQGVIMENEAYMFFTSTWGAVPKLFILDQDFWVILKEKNKAPYLIMLVRNVKEKWVA